MLQLIEEGNLSKEDVIEHLINNGFLPVEVTDFGRLPISIGISSIERPRSENQEKFSHVFLHTHVGLDRAGLCLQGQ